MSATGGPLESVSFAGREFAVTADSEAPRKLGGSENENSANGNGSARLLKNTVPWSLSGFSVEIDDTRGDHEFIQDLSDGKGYFDIAATYASGVVYQGVGNFTGELAMSNRSASMPVNVGGPGKFTPQ